MKNKSIALILTLLVIFNTSKAQELLASTIKIGPFKLDMKHYEVNKICSKKISTEEFKNTADVYDKMIDVTVDGVVYKLGFYANYNMEGNRNDTFSLMRIKCNDKRMRTKSGFSIGMNKFDVLKKLNTMNIGYQFSKYTTYDKEGNPTNKFVEYIQIIDNKASLRLTLEVENEKVSGFELYADEGGC